MLTCYFRTFGESTACPTRRSSRLFFGTGSFQVQASLGNTLAGLGGNVVTTWVADKPEVHTPSGTNSSTHGDTKTTTGPVITRNPNDGAAVTHSQITELTNWTPVQK